MPLCPPRQQPAAQVFGSQEQVPMFGLVPLLPLMSQRLLMQVWQSAPPWPHCDALSEA